MSQVSSLDSSLPLLLLLLLSCLFRCVLSFPHQIRLALAFAFTINKSDFVWFSTHKDAIYAEQTLTAMR